MLSQYNRPFIKSVGVFNFSSTIVILAGHQSTDQQGARLMREIKNQSKGEVRFVGVGGEQMLKEGMDRNYADLNKYLDKPFVPFKNFLRFHVERPWHPVMAPLHRNNKVMLQEMQKNGFYQDLLANKVDAFVTIGNEFLAKDLYLQLNQLYHQHDQVKPPTILLDKFHFNQRQEFTQYLDHFLYTVPMTPVNHRDYVFPSTNVGSQGVYDAQRYLYQNSQNLKGYLNANQIPVSSEHNKEVVEQLVEDERSRFRQNNNIGEDVFQFFLAPGSNVSEIKTSVDLFRSGLKKFLEKDEISKMTSSNFVAVICSSDEVSSYVQAEVSKAEFPCRLIVTNTPDQKFSAMAASDLGVAINGEIVNECAAMQLPTVVLNKMHFLQAYVTLLYNTYASDLNIACNGEGYPELMACKYGDAFPQKLAAYFEKWFNNPKTKYHISQKYAENIVKMLPTSTESQQSQSNQIVADHIRYNQSTQPSTSAAQKILEAVNNYQKVPQPQRHTIKNLRSEMLKNLRWQ